MKIVRINKTCYIRIPKEIADLLSDGLRLNIVKAQKGKVVIELLSENNE